MLVAAVDTSSSTLSCALLEAGPTGLSVLASREEVPTPATGGHSHRLPNALTELLGLFDKSVRDVEGWAVGLGPGSFTGLRIGLATWKGLAYANRRPIAGASSLEAMALSASKSAPAEALLVPLLDAKKGEVYAGFYRRSGAGVEAVLPEAALAPRALAERLAGVGSPVGFGEGYAAFRSTLSALLPELAGARATPPAEAVGRLAVGRLGSYDEAGLFALEPRYLRLSEAEVKFPDGLSIGPRSPK